MWRPDTFPPGISLCWSVEVWWVVQGLVQASPTPGTPSPTPMSQPHSLRHSKTHKSLPGGPKQRPRTRSAGTDPLSLLRPDKKGRRV